MHGTSLTRTRYINQMSLLSADIEGNLSNNAGRIKENEIS